MAIPIKNGKNAWSVAIFELVRQHLTNFIRTVILPYLDEDCTRILIRAPVKSGKREMVEYIAQRDYSHNPHRVHVFISSWHRTADQEQREELRLHNLKVFSIITIPIATECIAWIIQQLVAGKRVIIHIDECDFGTGQRQILGRVYRRFKNDDNVVFILYSATPQEVIFSGEIDCKEDNEYEELVDEVERGILCEYSPPAGYCGPSRFLDEGLIFDAKPFFEENPFRLSEQGRTIMHDLRESMRVNHGRNIIILRLSSADGNEKGNKQIYKFLEGVHKCDDLKDCIVIADNLDKKCGKIPCISSDNIQWSDDIYWKKLTKDEPIICVIDQTASRSTELCCHHRLFAYHDFRNSITFTTQSQAQERVNHYEQKYGGFQPIRVYGHRKTFELSAGRISYAEYMTNIWYKKKITNRNYYHIKHSQTDTIHPDFSQPLTLQEANHTLQNLSSFSEVKVSQRVRGRSKEVPVFDCKFIACTKETFDEKKDEIARLLEGSIMQLPKFKNPFLESEKKGKKNELWIGYLRKWDIFEYSDIDIGWGITGPGGSTRLTICYDKGELGIAVRWNTGNKQTKNTLKTYKSMYI